MKALQVQFRPFYLVISVFLAAMLIFLDGCSFLKPAPAAGEAHYYLLASDQVSESSVSRTKPGAYAVRILPVEVPGYLKTKDMVTRTGTNEIVFLKFHQWAEPLEAGIRRVLAQNLQASHEAKEVLTDQPSPAGVKVYVVSVHISTCEAQNINGRGSVLFDATWGLSLERTQTKMLARGVFNPTSSSWRPDDYSGLASQISAAIDGLGRNLSQAISEQADGYTAP